jgi:hypothetical protein
VACTTRPHGVLSLGGDQVRRMPQPNYTQVYLPEACLTASLSGFIQPGWLASLVCPGREAGSIRRAVFSFLHRNYARRSTALSIPQPQNHGTVAIHELISLSSSLGVQTSFLQFTLVHTGTAKPYKSATHAAISADWLAQWCGRRCMQ